MLYLKTLKIIISIFIMSSFIRAGAESVWLPNDVWKLVNFKGVYTRNSSDYVLWDDDGLNQIQDIADGETTYAVANADETDHLYNASDAPIEMITITDNNTTAIGATIGIFSIRGRRSPSPDRTEMDGSVTKSVAVKFSTAKLKSNLPMYRMYVKGDGNMPVLRLDYQADYEGDTFKVRFGEENYIFVAEFNYESTYANAAALVDERDRRAEAVLEAPIEDIVDFNITDNNLTQMATFDFDLENETHLTSYNSAIGNNIEIYTFQDNEWKLFNSANANANSNDFTSLNIGQGYWMKASSTLANADSNQTKIGLITNTSATFDKKAYTEKSDGSRLNEGWNMLSFKDSNLRYSPTGMFVDSRIGNVLLFFSSHGSTEGIDTNLTRDVSINPDDINSSVRYINAAVKVMNTIYNENISARAFPAISWRGDPGIIIISDTLFEINSSNTTGGVMGLSGGNLLPLSNGFQRTRYGDYILGLRMNDIDATSDVNVTMDISIPSINTGDFRVFDLNESNNSNKLTKIYNEFNNSSVNSAGNKRTSTNVFLVDFDFDSETLYSGTNPNYNVHDDILIAAGQRFSIEDTTYTKVFELVGAGSFRIVGSSTVDASFATNDVASLCAVINAQRESTDVVCTDLGTRENRNYFAITSNQTINLDLLEDNPYGTLFNDLPLDTTLPPETNTTFLKGAITKVFTHKDILYSSNVELNISMLDGNASYSNFVINANNLAVTPANTGTFTSEIGNTIADLRIAPAWSLDFPTDGPMFDFAEKNQRIDSILSLEYSNDMEPYWLISDLTNDPNEWYGNGDFASDTDVYNDDSQSLLKLNEDKAYWVKISPSTNPSIQIENNVNNLRTSYSQHFNSDIENSKPISLTTNNIDHTLYIKFIQNSSGELLNSDYYDVSASIKGKVYRLRKMGNAFQLRINNNYLAIEPELDKDIPIFISAYDSLGRKVVEEGTNNIYSLKYEKPPYPKLSWSMNGELIVLNADINQYEHHFYEGFISDTQSGRDDHYLEDNASNLSSFIDLLGWEKADGDADDGELRVIRAVTKKGGVYSDAMNILYAPLKFGHVIDLNKTDTSKSKPYSFLSKKLMQVDSGVQIRRLKKAVDDDMGVRIVYYPDGGLSKEGKNQLHSFSGTYTMFLKINSNDAYPLASITYLQVYAGKKFYINYGGKLYHGQFYNGDIFNNDSSSYPLTAATKKDLSGILSSTTYNLMSNGYEIDFGNSTGDQTITRATINGTSTEKKNAQPIYMPGKWDEESAYNVIYVEGDTRLKELGACMRDDDICIDSGGNTGGGNTGGGSTGGGGNTGGGNGLPTD